ncbi:MAG: TraX family protein [Bacillota bacterium]|jgi:hypothetical protein
MNSLRSCSTNNFFSLNSFQLKILACLFMAIDHVGYIMFPECMLLRLIGRLAFPLFAFMIANGFYYTKNRRRYLLRLFLFGLAIQIPFYLFTSSEMLNIFFTLSLGLAAIWLYDLLKDWHKGWGFLCVAACAVLAQLLHLDYQAYGVLLIFTSYLLFNDLKRLIIPWGIINFANFLLLCLTSSQGFHYQWAYIQSFSLVSIIFILMYNRQEGRKATLLFYIFYPSHLAAIYLLSQIIR